MDFLRVFAYVSIEYFDHMHPISPSCPPLIPMNLFSSQLVPLLLLQPTSLFPSHSPQVTYKSMGTSPAAIPLKKRFLSQQSPACQSSDRCGASSSTTPLEDVGEPTRPLRR